MLPRQQIYFPFFKSFLVLIFYFYFLKFSQIILLINFWSSNKVQVYNYSISISMLVIVQPFRKEKINLIQALIKKKKTKVVNPNVLITFQLTAIHYPSLLFQSKIHCVKFSSSPSFFFLILTNTKSHSSLAPIIFYLHLFLLIFDSFPSFFFLD